MTPAARHAAAIEILDAWIGGAALEPAFLAWSRRSRFAGSKDRAAIRDLIFDAARRRRSSAALGGAETGRGLILGLLRARGKDPAAVFTGEGYAPDPLSTDEAAASPPPNPRAALDLPDWLLPLFEAAFGTRAPAICEVLRHRAPTHLRVALARTTRDDAIAALAREGIAAQPVPDVKTALEVTENERKVGASRVLSEGLAELQDAASQAVCLALADHAPRRVLDFCAGGGGKSLALADLTEAEVIAHDIDPRRMRDLPVRMARAGVEIATVATADLPGLAPLDMVFCDAPCSGSGAWRRDPSGKWRLTPDRLTELCRLQTEVLDAAAPRVAPGGLLAYATCSVLRAENEEAVAAFLGRAGGWEALSARRFDPGPHGDGFFLALLRRR